MGETETIEPKEAREPVAAGDLYVVDVRSEEMLEEDPERIPGAVHIPGDELESRLDEVPDDKKILLVTPDGEGCEEVAERIRGEDREVAILAGGVAAWRSERLMTQPSEDPDPPKGEDEEPFEAPDDGEDEGDDRDEEDEGDEDPDEAEQPREGESQ